VSAGKDPLDLLTQGAGTPVVGSAFRSSSLMLPRQPGTGPGADVLPEVNTRWAWLGGSATGASHLNTGTPNQDAWLSHLLLGEHQDLLLLAVADGAGSKMRGQAAAEHSVAVTRELIDSAVSQGVAAWDLDAWRIVELIQESLRTLAEQEDVPLAEYACTLTVAVLTPTRSLLFQVGDGFMVYRPYPEHEDAPEPALRLAFVPANGEYVNSTTFVNAATPADVQASVIDTPEQIALSSDGLYRLIVQLSDLTPHEPFFLPFFGVLTQPGIDPQRAANLSTYLAGQDVQTRSDDDLTLLLAQRL